MNATDRYVFDSFEIDYFDNGKVSRIIEINSDYIPCGFCAKWNTDGSLREISNRVNGMLHGQYNDWHPNGNMWEDSYYINDNLHGFRQLWYANGAKLRQGYYENGERQGMHISWHRTGEIDEIVFYRNHMDITYEIHRIVKDIRNITDCEKTHIALLYGFIL